MVSPRSYLAESDRDSYSWRENYIQTFLERDVPNLGFRVPSGLLLKILGIRSHGQLLTRPSLGSVWGICLGTSYTATGYASRGGIFLAHS